MMNSNDVLDTGLRVYRNLGWSFLRLTTAPSVFCLSGIAFVLLYVLPSLGWTHHAGSINGQLGESATAVALALVIGGPLFLFGTSYTCALVVNLTSDYMLGHEIDATAAQRSAMAITPTLIAVAFRELLLASSGMLIAIATMGVGGYLSQFVAPDSPLAGGVVLIGGLGLFAGIIYFLHIVTVHSLVPAIAVLEKLKGKMAGRRSLYLLKNLPNLTGGTGALWNVGAFMLVAGIIEWVGFTALFQMLNIPDHLKGFFLSVPFAGVIAQAIDLIPTFLVVWTLMPVWASCVTIVYYERRIRLEGFDIEALADEIVRNRQTSRFDV